MSAYFDGIDAEIAAVGRLEDPYAQSRVLEAVEGKLVTDVTVCAMFPGFPLDLRKRIHEVVLRDGVYNLPVNAKLPEIDTVEEHRARLFRMSFDLHTVFHDVLSLAGHPDDPRAPLRALYARGEAEREQLVAALTPAEPPTPDPDPETPF